MTVIGKISDKPMSRFQEIVGDEIDLRARFPAAGLRLPAVTRSNQHNPPAPGCPGTLDILEAVSDHARGGQIQGQIGLRPIDQAGLRFSAIASILGDMGTVVNGLYLSAAFRDRGGHLLMDTPQPGFGDELSVNDRLIGHDDDTVLIDRQKPDRLKASRHKLEL